MTDASTTFDSQYYQNNSQDVDRPAFYFYERLWRRYMSSGPVLEFGCGIGMFAKRLSRHTQVFCYEVNEFACEQIAINAPLATPISGVDSLADSSVDTIIALHVLEHISDDDLVGLGVEFRRVLPPGGKLLVVMPNVGGRAHQLKGADWAGFSDPTHINLKSSGEWSDFFESTWQLKILHAFADGFYEFPYETDVIKSVIKDGWRAALTGLQFVLARCLLSANYGENIVFILECPSDGHDAVQHLKSVP